MTSVFFFGKERIRPNIYSDYTPIIKKISFLGKDIINFDSKEEKKMFEDYIEMIKFVQEKDLCFKSVVCSQNTAFILDAKDELWVFGEGGDGQLGISKLKAVLRQPINMSRFQNRYFTSLSCYSTHALAISSTHKLYTWGNTEFGCQGSIMQNRYVTEPEKVKKNKFEEYIPEDQYSQMKVTHVASSTNFSLVTVNKCYLFSFGKEEKSRLGLGQFNIDYTDKVYKVDLPFSNIQIKGIACGKNHCLLWDTEGQIYSWGDGSHGKLGHSSVKGGYNYMIVNPQKIKALEDQKIISASCGYNHSCAINFKGEIYTWGKTIYSKDTKENQKIDYLRPKKLSCYIKSEQNIQIGTHIIKISSYGNQNAVIDDKGYVYTWGQNVDNCLGHVDSKDYNFPVCIEELTGTYCIDIGCGENFTVVIASEKQNKLAYYNIKEFYTGILDNAKEKVQKIKDFYQRKISKTMSLNQPLDDRQLKALNRMGSIVNTPSAFLRGDSPLAFQSNSLQKQQSLAINLDNQSQQKVFNFPKSDVQKLSKPSSNILLRIQEEQRKASFETFHIKKQIRQADTEIKKTTGEFQGYKKSNSCNKSKRSLLHKKLIADKDELKKEIILDEVTQKLQIDEDEFKFHEENKQQEERKNVKNDPREFIQKKPKGVLVNSIFKEQIDLIYKEYTVTEKKENLQEKYLKNVRSKEDDFFKSRMKTDSSIRQKFSDARKDMSFTKSNLFTEQEDYIEENMSQSTTSNMMKGQYFFNSNNSQQKKILHSRPQTASSQHILQTTFSQRSIQNVKGIFTGNTEGSVQFPQGDFLKKQKFQINQKHLDAKKDKIIANSVLRDFRTDIAKKKKMEIEEEKKQQRDQKRIDIYMKSREYLSRVAEDQQFQSNTDSIRNNWAVYLNAEMICAGLKKLAQLGLENLRKEFFIKVRIRKMQFQVRDYLMRKKIRKLTSKQIFIMRQLIRSWVKRKQIEKMVQATKLIVLHTIQQKIKKKLRVKISIKRNQIMYMQNFIRWARKSLHQQRRILCQIWDTHIIHIFRQQIVSRNLDGKQLDVYRSKFSHMLATYTAVKSSQSNPIQPALLSSLLNETKSIAQQQQLLTTNSDLNASTVQNNQYSKLQNLQVLNIQDFQTVNGQLQDFDSYLKGKTFSRSSDKKNKNSMVMNKVQQIGFTLKESYQQESIHEIIKRKAQQNTMFGGLLEQLKFKAKAKDEQVMEYEEEELQNLDSKYVSPQKSRNVLFKENNNIQDDKSQKGHKSILKGNSQKENKGNGSLSSSFDSSSSDDDEGSEFQIEQENLLKKKNSKNAKIHQRRKQVFKKDEFSFADSLLPFSLHYFDLLLPSNYTIRIDSLKNSNVLAMEIAKLAEICVKQKIIESILILTRTKYQKQLSDYNQKRKDFIEANKYLINLERAKIMLETPSEILKGMHKREDVQIAMKKKISGADHLPFEELKQIIADRLPNAPKQPAFKVTINQELFRTSFHKYVDSLRRLIQEIEIKGIFKGTKKKENNTQNSKKNQDEEDDDDISLAQLNMDRLNIILRNFERNFKL